MRKVTDKDVVKLKYKLTVHDGTVVEDSGDDAVDMIMGKGLIIPGFEKFTGHCNHMLSLLQIICRLQKLILPTYDE